MGASPTVGVVGLGNMGGSMARHLVDEGLSVAGTDVDGAANSAFVEYGGSAADSPADLAARVDVLVSSLPTPAVVREVYLGEAGVLEGADAGLVALEMSTIDPDTVVGVADRAAERGVTVLGAPVSGGPPNARDGTLTVMVGGDRGVYESEPAAPVVDALSGTRYFVGGVDAGHTIKLVNNVMSLGNLAIALEATSLAASRGIDGELLLDVLGDSGGSSRAFERVFPRVLERDFDAEFALDLARKDLGLAMETAAAMDQPMVAASVVFNLFVEASARGLGGEDVGALVKLFEASSEVPVADD